METSRAWRAFTPDTRHHNQTYWSLLSVLFVEPGLNRTVLIERVIAYAAVSRSTAERAIREARESGYVVDRPAGAEVRYFLSDRLLGHCVGFFREHMDLERLILRSFAATLTLVAMLASATTACTENTGQGAAVGAAGAGLGALGGGGIVSGAAKGAAAGAAGGFIYDKVTGND